MNAVTKEESTALTLPERAAVALGAADYEVKIKAKVAASTDITAVIDPAGREQAHRIGMDLLKLRTGITAAGEAARKDATAFSKAVIAKEKELVGLIAPEETRVFGLRDGFDEKAAAEKAAKIAAERARTDAIQAAIQAILDIPLAMIGKSAQDISRCIAGLVGTVPDEFYQESIEQAKAARLEALDKLAAAETAQRAIEIEAESKRQESARIALAAEEARKAAEKRAAEEAAAVAAQRIENERVANEQAAERQRLANLAAVQEAEARRVREQAAANLKADREAQELAMRLEREKIAAEQAKALAEIKAARDRLDAALAAQSAAVKMGADHAEALEMNAVLDAAIARIEPVEKFASDDAAAQLARCTATTQAMLTNGPRLIADSIATYIDAGMAEDSNDEPFIDYEAIAWAYAKLLAYGVGNTGMDNALMLDRLNLMLLADGLVPA